MTPVIEAIVALLLQCAIVALSAIFCIAAVMGLLIVSRVAYRVYRGETFDEIMRDGGR